MKLCLWILLATYATIEVIVVVLGRSCTWDETVQYTNSFIKPAKRRGLTMASLDRACIKIIRATEPDDKPSNVELLILGYSKPKGEYVSVVSQIEMDCASGKAVPVKVGEDLCAIVEGDLGNCKEHGTLNGDLLRQIIPALSGATGPGSCPGTGQPSDAAKKALKAVERDRLNIPGATDDILSRYVTIPAATGIASGKNEGKLLLVLQTILKSGNAAVIVHALASKKSKLASKFWEVEKSEDVLYAIDGKVTPQEDLNVQLKKTIDYKTITAALKTLNSELDAQRENEKILRH